MFHASTRSRSFLRSFLVDNLGVILLGGWYAGALAFIAYRGGCS